MNNTILVTTHDYQNYSVIIDKLFSGETYLFKQYDSEKFVSLITKLIELKEDDNLEELKSYLSILERNHWDQRDYDKIINQLESFHF